MAMIKFNYQYCILILFSFSAVSRCQVELLCKITTGLCLSTVSATTLIWLKNIKKTAAPKIA